MRLPYHLTYNYMDKKKISQYLKRFIDQNELTQEQFARLISAPLSSVSNWVLGKRNMSQAWQTLLKDKKILPQEEENTDLDFHY